MKKLLLLTGVSALSLPVMADMPTPVKIDDANAYAMSYNGEYLVAYGMSGGAKIYNLVTGQMADFSIEGGNDVYHPGIAKTISDNGIVVGNSDSDEAVYYLGGEWHNLKRPAFTFGTSSANAISADGMRICGNIEADSFSESDDTLMQVPVVWTWDEAKGDFGVPVLLPHPERDFTGRIPQYIKAVDISADGKTVIGQLRTANGMFHYPIVYKVDEEGEWSFYTLYDDKIVPEGLSLPEYPGENPVVFPDYKDYMTRAEIQAYDKALDEWYDSGFTAVYPELCDYMDPEQYAAYEAAYKKAEEENEAWSSKFLDWLDVISECQITWNDFEFNSIRISADGKTFANTMLVPGEPDYEAGYIPISRNVWVFDIDGTVLAKYDEDEDYTLTWLANGGVAFATTYTSGEPQAFILTDGKATEVTEWISGQIPAYKSWIDENLTFDAEIGIPGPNGGEIEYVEVEASGRACATPDLSKIALGIENFWDFADDGATCVFDMKAGSQVGAVSAAVGEQMVFDLNGRRVKNLEMPGIYIVNGEKKVIR